MGSSSSKRSSSGKKVRVQFRRNRSARARTTDWTKQAREADDNELDLAQSERITAKGALSRGRTVLVPDDYAKAHPDLHHGVVVATRGLFADVDVSGKVFSCTIRRILRTRMSTERHPLTVGDRVFLRVETESATTPTQPKRSTPLSEAVIEAVEPRRGRLQRKVGRKTQTIVANVDQAIIVASADDPPPKPHLIDRYIVSAHTGDITPVVCMNKTDLDGEGIGKAILDRYTKLGYVTCYTSIITKTGIDELRAILADKASVIAGQSGVGKSSLLNAVQPGLRLRVGDVGEQTGKGRHTTTTATLIRLDVGGHVVDTPGIRTFDASLVANNELEVYFVEFVEHVPNCKFPDCTHIHEAQCAVKLAVERGLIHPDRYASYVRLFEEPANLA